jgi:hypothetical protein
MNWNDVLVVVAFAIGAVWLAGIGAAVREWYRGR